MIYKKEVEGEGVSERKEREKGRDRETGRKTDRHREKELFVILYSKPLQKSTPIQTTPT